MGLRAFFQVKSWLGNKSSSSKGMRHGLWRDQRGAVAPMFLLTATAVLGSSFGAIDLVRYNVVQGRLQNALDGATLSAGRNLANLTPTPGTPAADQWQADAFQYFSANLPQGYLGSSVQPEDLKIEYTEEKSNGYLAGQFVAMSVKGDLPLISTGFLRVTSFQIGASNQAVRRTRSDLEVVLALDNTGSMSGTKLTTLKSAAKELTKVVLGAAATDAPQSVFVGLVPFADTVNVGNTPATRGWLKYPVEQTNYVNKFWRGCIVEPKGNWGKGNNLPAQALTPSSGFQPLHLTWRTKVDGDDLELADKKNNHERISTAIPLNPPNPFKLQPISLDANGADYDRRVWARRSSDTTFDVYSAADPEVCQTSRLSYFLSSDQAVLDDAIDGMKAAGSTLVPTGLLWAWRMLHPGWRGTPGWGDPDKPRNPEPNKLSKVIVLLTDGKNEPSGSSTGPTSDTNNFAFKLTYDVETCEDSDFTKKCKSAGATRTYTQKKFDPDSGDQFPMTSLRMRDPFSTNNNNSQSSSIGWNTDNNMSTSSVDNYLKAVCANVKADGNGIKIYTVTLGDVGSSTETLMNGCSSGAGYFYNATNVNDLPEVFKSIAGALTELRLTQ